MKVYVDPITSQKLPLKDVPTACPEIAINTYVAIKQNPYATLDDKIELNNRKTII